MAPPEVRERDTGGKKGGVEPRPQCGTVVKPLCDCTAKENVERRAHEKEKGGEESLIQARIKRGRKTKSVERRQEKEP